MQAAREGRQARQAGCLAGREQEGMLGLSGCAHAGWLHSGWLGDWLWTGRQASWLAVCEHAGGKACRREGRQARQAGCLDRKAGWGWLAAHMGRLGLPDWLCTGRQASWLGNLLELLVF